MWYVAPLYLLENNLNISFTLKDSYYHIIDSGYEVGRTVGGNAVLRGRCVCIFYATGQVPVPTILPPTPCSPI